MEGNEITTHAQLREVTDALAGEVRALEIGTKEEAEAAAGLLTKRIVPMLATAELVKAGYYADHRKACEAANALTKTRGELEGKLLAWRDAAQEQSRRDALVETGERIAAADDAKLDQAVALENMGRPREAEALLATPTMAPVATPQSVELDAVSVKPNWVPVVYDLRALAAAAADPEQEMVPIDAVQPNAKLLNSMAKSLKGNFAWPGCRAENQRRIKPEKDAES